MVLGEKFFQRINKISLWRMPLLALGGAIILLTNPQNTLAAEKVTFTYGLASQSVTLEELETFVATGQISPALDFILDLSGQNPDVVRWLLTQELPTDTVMMSKMLNSLLGEYILKHTSSVVHSRSPRANVKAIRGALIVSSEDGKVSLLELWRNYPTKQVYVDGKFLANISHKVSENLENLK